MQIALKIRKIDIGLFPQGKWNANKWSISTQISASDSCSVSTCLDAVFSLRWNMQIFVFFLFPQLIWMFGHNIDLGLKGNVWLRTEFLRNKLARLYVAKIRQIKSGLDFHPRGRIRGRINKWPLYSNFKKQEPLMIGWRWSN